MTDTDLAERINCLEQAKLGRPPLKATLAVLPTPPVPVNFHPDQAASRRRAPPSPHCRGRTPGGARPTGA